MPDVTVLLAAHDAEAGAATVQDLLAQTLAEVEIVVLLPADAPPVSDDPRVRTVVAAGEGLGPALDRGLALARGAFVARVVSGDRSAPERLARQAGLLRTAAEVAFVGTGWRAIGADGSVARQVRPPAGDAALRAAMAAGDAIGHPTAMMRRDAVVKAGGWRPAFVGFEDYDLLLRLMDRSAGACTPEPLVEFAVDEDGRDRRALEQGIFAEMAAVAALDRRQAGRPDHGDQASPADRALLHRMGLVDAEITRAVVARALALAVAAGARGQWRAMREAAGLGLRQEGAPAAVKFRFAALWLRSLARLRPSG